MIPIFDLFVYDSTTCDPPPASGGETAIKISMRPLYFPKFIQKVL